MMVEFGSVVEVLCQFFIVQLLIFSVIKGFEESFGVKLFICYYVQGVLLMLSGMCFYWKVQELLCIVYEFEQNVFVDNDVIIGQIDIGCFEMVVLFYLL